MIFKLKQNDKTVENYIIKINVVNNNNYFLVSFAHKYITAPKQEIIRYRIGSIKNQLRIQIKIPEASFKTETNKIGLIE